ncbi:MAG: hypothetical protein K8T90_03295, partial [Planctomycetes bacterium]|nr:hypothetical protein [Planctomycetota bacterium]
LGFATGSAAERTEFVALLERAAALCEESGATALARRALRRAGAVDAPGAARAMDLADALDRRVAERIERLQAGVRGDPRARGALAIVLAGDGRLAPADEIAGTSALPADAFPGAAAVLWIQSRWFARGTREGFERASGEAMSLATRGPPEATADARFLVARSLEELGDTAAATDAFGWIYLHRHEMSGDDDARVRWAARYLAARDRVDAVPLSRIHTER